MFICYLTKTRCVVQCDQCEKKYELCRSQVKDNLHFCSRFCVNLAKQPGGKIAEKIKKTNLEKYGCENVFSSESIKKKIKSSLTEKYGVDNPQKSKEIKSRTKQTCIERYGFDNPAKSEIVRSKEIATIKNKTQEEKEKILEKRKQTNTEKYGAAFPMQVPFIKEKFDWSTAYKKSTETKKKNKTGTWSSKVEILLKDELIKIFQIENVQEQVSLNGKWTIDFYVTPIDSYVQLDGIYWHGLDRPIETIKEFKSSKDERILRTYYKDREQDQWAETNNIKFYRITDEEIKKWQKLNDLRNQILLRLNQSVQK
jgi:hypothetical protein